MLLKRRVAAVVAALAVGAPVASASAQTIPGTGPGFFAALGFGAPMATVSPAITPGAVTANPNPSCPSWYHGPTNLATGCPYWLMR
jgi:hypothetical protein